MKNFERDIILIGGKPGSGKSRLSREIALELGKTDGCSAEHISIGDHIRKIGTGAIRSAYGKLIEEHLTETPHELIDDEIICEILAGRIARSGNTDLLLIDGMPRRKSQIDVISTIADQEKRTIRGLIVTHTSDEIAQLRLSIRALRAGRNKVEVSTIALRLAVHDQHFPDVIAAYQNSNLPIEKIDTTDKKGGDNRNRLDGRQMDASKSSELIKTPRYEALLLYITYYLRSINVNALPLAPARPVRPIR